MPDTQRTRSLPGIWFVVAMTSARDLLRPNVLQAKRKMFLGRNDVGNKVNKETSHIQYDSDRRDALN